MRKLIPLFAISSIVFSSSTVFAALNPQDLIKVTPEDNPKCVEYFDYKGSMYCSTSAQSDEKPDPNIKNYEKQKIVFDDRPWQAAWGKDTPEMTTVEYIPLGDNINHWQELITSQFAPGLQDKASPKQFADMVIANIKEAGFHPIVTFIKETPELVIFEFRITSPDNQIQDEIQLIKKGKDGLYMLHYTIKVADMGQQNRDKWVALLEQSSLK